MQKSKERCGTCKFCWADEWGRYCGALPEEILNTGREKPCIYYMPEDKDVERNSKN